jgi:hypothetical protein
MAITTLTPSTTNEAPSAVKPVKARRVKVERLIEEAPTEATLTKLAAGTDPRTARELRVAWRHAA